MSNEYDKNIGFKNNLLAIDQSSSAPSLSVQTIATIGAVVGVVVIPTLFHFIGFVIGVGSLLGRIFLPMYLPIILVGLVAGPIAGVVAGIIGPIVSFLISGMPAIAGLPAMTIELAFFGLVSGLLRGVKASLAKKIALIQVSGLIVLFAVELLSEIILGTGVNMSTVLATVGSTLIMGLPGLILQWALVPFVLSWAKRAGIRINNGETNESN